MERDTEYENNNIAYDEQYTEEEGGGGIKCKNYELCEAVLPKWWFECKGNYLCTNCHMMFGTWGIYTGKGILDISDNIECPVCLEVKRSISQPNCEHTICIDCFKRCYYGDDDIENEPQFPYPKDIEAKYWEEDTEVGNFPEITHLRWPNNFYKEYPLIEVWNEEVNKWEDEKNQKHENEKNLQKCPLCRA